MTISKEEEYDYSIPIFYKNIEEEKEAYSIGIKLHLMSYGKSIGYGKDNTLSSSQEKYEDIFKSGNYIAWKQLRKSYAKYLDSNPFETGDKIVCIGNETNAKTKKIGDTFTVGKIKVNFIGYSDGQSAIYTDFKLVLDLNFNKDWRDAFIEKLGKYYEKSNYADSWCIKCNNESICSDGAVLLSYVTLFQRGGFWYDINEGLHFVVGPVKNHDTATYEHALKFINNFRSKDKI